MHGTLRKAMGFGLVAVVAALALAPPAWSDDDRKRHDRDRHRDERHERDRQRHERHEAAERHRHRRHIVERREWERRRQLERHRAAAFWRFEHGRGWRFEHRPGLWSPAFVWWAVDGRPLLRPYPTVRIVRYPTGYYELVGDGFTTPYYWVWRPTVVVATPPPPVPLPPPPAEYPFPADGVYAPPPPGG